MENTDAPLAGFHWLLAEWFQTRLGAPTVPQRLAWPEIQHGHDTLIAAPTGSGKTMAGFFACLDSLWRMAERDGLPSTTQVLYLSPLKALSNDVQINLEKPLAEINQLAEQKGLPQLELLISVRTGDTPQHMRAKFSKTPPHVLVTTPESFYILLTSEKGRASLSNVKTVIVDEIHAMAGDKRGAHLSLSLERLHALVTGAGNPPPQRIGLSATQKPISEIAALLVGTGRALPHIVDAGFVRELDLAIEMTDDVLGSVASNEQMGRVYDRIAEMVRQHKTTLVFVNTRRQVERVAHLLEERLGEDQVVAHHGSLSRDLRHAAERKLKFGHVPCAVATASLELGIDVGDIDLVVQIGSPRAIATLLQRVGRSGHALSKTPKGRLFASTRDQLIEAMALIRAISARRLDAICIRENCFDILAQQIVAMVACEPWPEDKLFATITQSYCYRNLSRKDFDQIILMLAEGVDSRHGRKSAHLHRDGIAGILKPRKGARLAAITCGGAIPDIANVPVVRFPDEVAVGSVDEDFAIDSGAGDVFLLGNTSWRIRRIETTRMWVEDAAGAPPSIPFWFGEAPGRTRELSQEISELRREVEDGFSQGLSADEIVDKLAQTVGIPRSAAAQASDYLLAALRSLGGLPSHKQIIAERFFDDAGGMHLVLHAPFGARINKAWGLALRKRFCRSFNQELQAVATDDGLLLSLGPVHSFPLADVFAFLHPNTAEEILTQAVLAAPVFAVRWKWAVTRALAVLRRFGGKKIPPHLLRMRCDDLLSLVFPMQQACLENVVGDIEIPEHPLVRETMKDALQEFLDVRGFLEVVTAITNGEISTLACDTPEPSPLCHEIVNANPYAFLDDAPLEERRTRAVSLPKVISQEVAAMTGQPVASSRHVPANIVEAIEREAAPSVRDEDELHDLLLMRWLVLDGEIATDWRTWLTTLCNAGRAILVEYQNPTTSEILSGWVAGERVKIADEVFRNQEPLLASSAAVQDFVDALIGSFLAYRGPQTLSHLSQTFGIASPTIAASLANLESQGWVLRGDFVVASEEQFCDRRILARLHKRSVSHLRKEVEAVSPAAFMRFLFRWQRVLPAARLEGRSGLAIVIEQLQGFEASGAAWEAEILPARLRGYQSAWLDELCMSGQVAWARLSPRDIDSTDESSKAKRFVPSRQAPLGIVQRADLLWLRAYATACDPNVLSPSAQTLVQELTTGGALFLVELCERTQLAADKVEEGLWELVALGFASADGMAGLRALLHKDPGIKASRFDAVNQNQLGQVGPSGRLGQAIARARAREQSRSRHAMFSLPGSAGRWSRLPVPSPDHSDVARWAKQLITRYGIVFRDMLTRETNLPPWRDLLGMFRRLEARGEIRGGRFIEGFVGEQFAAPEAVEQLRFLRNPPSSPEIVTIPATCALNLVGITSPGPKVPALRGNAILFKNGVAIASKEQDEMRLRVSLGPGEHVTSDLRYTSTQQRSFEQISLLSH